MKKIFALLAISVLLSTGFALAKGFDDYGYNRQARNFVGTCLSWHMGKFGSTEAQAQAYCGEYSDDKLKMKWNAEWDRGNEEGWTDPNGYDAWEDNLWNGKVPGGSGEVWHYRIKWVGECPNGEAGPNGGYCIWGQFEVLMDHGTSNGEHLWFAHASPSGYGN